MNFYDAERLLLSNAACLGGGLPDGFTFWDPPTNYVYPLATEPSPTATTPQLEADLGWQQSPAVMHDVSPVSPALSLAAYAFSGLGLDQISHFLSDLPAPFVPQSLFATPTLEFDGDPTRLLLRKDSPSDAHHENRGIDNDDNSHAENCDENDGNDNDNDDDNDCAISGQRQQSEIDLFPPLPLQKKRNFDSVTSEPSEASEEPESDSPESFDHPQTPEPSEMPDSPIPSESESDSESDEFYPPSKRQRVTKKKQKKAAPRSRTASAKERPHECSICGARFTRRYNLGTHERTHDKSRPKPFSCTQCPKAFDRKHDRERHLATVHRGERSNTCHICHTAFSRKEALNRHIDALHPNAC